MPAKRKKKPLYKNRIKIGTGLTGAICFVIFLALAVTNYYKIFTYDDMLRLFNLADKPATNAKVSVHFIDVGQGDSTLIIADDKTVLIDAGEAEYGTKVVNYLKSQNVTRLDYVIATHPHSDHIGGLAFVLSQVKTDNIIMPMIEKSVVPTTKTYENLLLEIKNLGLKITSAKVGEIINLGDSAKLEIIGPVKDYDDLNNYSVVSKLTHGENSFLFTGDIESKAENDILNADENVSAKVLQVAHHGSDSSNKSDFLNSVGADYFVIQCGIDNSYNHPNQKVVNRLLEHSDKIYRTDLDGDIVFESDGEGLNVILR